MKCLSSCLWPVETSRVHKLGAIFEGAVDHLTTVTKVDRMEIANRSCHGEDYAEMGGVSACVSSVSL